MKQPFYIATNLRSFRQRCHSFDVPRRYNTHKLIIIVVRFSNGPMTRWGQMGKLMSRYSGTNQTLLKTNIKKELHSEISWKADKGEGHLMQSYLSFTEEVREVLHGIATDTGYVLVLLWFWGPQRLDTIPNIIRYFDSDLKAQHELVWEKWWQLHWTKVKTQRETYMKGFGNIRDTCHQKELVRSPKRPPYPHPISANSTWWVFSSEGLPGKKCGYSSDQSISSGQTGLMQNFYVKDRTQELLLLTSSN